MRGCVKTVQAADPELSLDMLCGHFGISLSYAEKLFQQHIGMPFRDRRPVPSFCIFVLNAITVLP